MIQPSPSDDASSAFLPPGWDTLAPLLDAALDAAPDERERVLDHLAGGDPDLRARLAQLVADGDRAMPELDSPAMQQYVEIADDAPPVPPLLGERYRPERELGRGGMARVYLARDIRHGRDVAVKVIRQELAASLGRERFLREIAIAARLRHPNIVPLYDSGDANGLLYFVMPYEDGPSLRTRLSASGRLPIGDATTILRDVARALQYAHAQGVVHRDIKPDNVMTSGGAAVVADFGIAKAVSAAQSETQGRNITQTGAGIGTPAYMAPEQAVGDPSSDHRADIYSFGCLAYELFVGEPPFRGRSAHQVIAAHVSVVPSAVVQRRDDVPVAVSQLIARCLEKEPADRPQSATEILLVLEGDGAAPRRDMAPPRPEPVRSPARSRVAIGAAVVLALGAAGAFMARTPAAAAPPISLSVLPISNIGNDTSLVPFGRGLGDEVFNALSRVPGLQMRSRIGARAYAGPLGVDDQEVGRKLHVDFLVGGEMRDDHGRLRITMRLTQTSDATEIWNESFSVDPQQQISVADEIANGAAAALRRRFPNTLGSTRALQPNQTTRSPEAHRLYVLGQELLSRRGLSVRESADRFREAIRLDSNYAGAHAGLSMALALFPYFQGTPAEDVAGELSASAARALRLDSTLAQPHVALGLANQHRYRWDTAGVEFREAIRLGPTDVEAHVQYGRYLLFLLRTEDALEQFQLARHEDPASPLVLSWVSYAYSLAGQRDSARVISAQALQGNVMNFTAYALGAHVMLVDGLRDSARALIRRVSSVTGYQSYVLGATGDTVLAREQIAATRQRLPRSSTANTSLGFVALGMRDSAAALTALERATDAREMWPELQPVSDPMFDPVRATPRFRALLQRVGLPSMNTRAAHGTPAP